MTDRFNIINIFDETVMAYPERIALIDGDRQVTFTQFQRDVNATAAMLHRKGLKNGDRIMVFVPMSIDLYRVVLAIFKIGATAVFLDEWVNKSRLEACCRIADCKGFVGSWKVRALALFSPEMRKIPVWMGLRFPPNLFPEEIAFTDRRDDTALITFTTGSTSVPKAAVRTHALLHEQLKALTRIIKPAGGEISMPVLPIVLLINLAQGVTSVIVRLKSGKISSVQTKKLAEQITKHKVTTLIASPFIVKQLAIFQQNRPSPLIKIFTGGAPVFPQEAKMYVTAFPTADIRIVYGSTEAEPIADIDAKELSAQHQCEMINGLDVGRPDPNVEIRIIKITDEPISPPSAETLDQYAMAPGEIGEIIVSGPHVLREYVANEAAIRRNKIFMGDQCWHRTGDSGFLDANGHLRLTGRCNALILYHDKIIAPFMYEGFFQTISGVELATVLPYGRGLAFIIELNDLTQQKRVRDAIEMKIEESGEIIFLKKIPRDPRHHSKIDYGQLKQTLVKHRILIDQRQK
jgi:olefin beta-lactone synthetase